MKTLTNLFLLALTSFGSIAFAQEPVNSSARDSVPYVFKPSPTPGPLVILKSDDRTLQVEPRENEKFDFESIDSKMIKSITVLKKENATNAYGEKGRHGVLIIQLADNYIFPIDIYKRNLGEN